MPRNKIEAEVITETFDPSIWSIAVALSLAVLYLCLT